MKVGDLVRPNETPPLAVLAYKKPRFGDVGVVVKRLGYEIVYIYWGEGTGKPVPMSMRWLEKVR